MTYNVSELNCSEVADRTGALAAMRETSNYALIPALVTAITALESEIAAWVEAIPMNERQGAADCFRENELTSDILTTEARRQLEYVVELLEGRDPNQTSTSHYWKGIRSNQA